MLNGENIEFVNHYKYLRIILGSTLFSKKNIKYKTQSMLLLIKYLYYKNYKILSQNMHPMRFIKQ